MSEPSHKVSSTPPPEPTDAEVQRVAQQWLANNNGHPVSYGPSDERLHTVRQVLEAARSNQEATPTLAQAHEELRRMVRLAQMALQSFGDTEEGVHEAYVTLQLGLDTTANADAKAMLETAIAVQKDLCPCGGELTEYRLCKACGGDVATPVQEATRTVGDAG